MVHGHSVGNWNYQEYTGILSDSITTDYCYTLWTQSCINEQRPKCSNGIIIRWKQIYPTGQKGCSDKLRMFCAMSSPSLWVKAWKKPTTFVWSWGVSSVTIPASSNTSLGLGANFSCWQAQANQDFSGLGAGFTSMFPGCRSACTKLSETSIWKI